MQRFISEVRLCGVTEAGDGDGTWRHHKESASLLAALGGRGWALISEKLHHQSCQLYPARVFLSLEHVLRAATMTEHNSFRKISLDAHIFQANTLEKVKNNWQES